MPDIRHSFRTILKQPLFSGIVILTFALGIGANTAVFSVVNAVVLRPLPFHEPEKLVAVAPYDRRVGSSSAAIQSTVSYPDFVDLRAQNRVFERVAVYKNESLALTDGKQAVHVQVASVSADLFPLLGVEPVLGRSFLAEEDEPGKRGIILSYATWQQRFGADPNILGRAVILDREQFQIVGVMPPGFEFPLGSSRPELWTSISRLREAKGGAPAMTEQRGNDFLKCIARIRPATSLQRAQANVDAIAADLRRQYPDSNMTFGVKVLPFAEALIADAHPALLMLCAMAACVLLVACVNVANLLLARSVSRHREISIRAALGATRWQMVKGLVTESALLGLLGGTAGFLVAIWGLDSVKPFLPTGIPRIDEISPDIRVLLFTTIVSVAVGILAGLLPAWRASHANAAGTLNEGARGSTESARGRKIRGALVVVEMVLALVLLASAGLLAKSLLNLQRVHPGFDPRHVMTARISLPEAIYAKPEQAADFYNRLLARISALPGVQSAAAAWWMPLSGSNIEFNFDIQERPLPKGEQPISQVNAVTIDYFKTMHVPLLKGREFTPRDDRAGPPVVVISESFARQFFHGDDPIGKKITSNGAVDGNDPPMREIVGVVADVRLISLRASPQPQIYLPHQQFAVQGMSILVRTENDPQSIVASLRNAISEIDKNVPLFRPRPLSDYLSQSIAQPRLNAMLVGLFALIALLLAAAGVFGAMSYSVSQRTQEIGIRLALGAQRLDVLRLIVRHGMQLVLIGLCLGFAGIFISGRLLQSLLFGIGPTDFETITLVTIFLSAVGFGACWFPAFRASQVDPIIALRSE
jgi:predicted permease